MCFGGGSKTAAPAPQPVGVQSMAPNAVADNSNDPQRKAAAVAASSTTAPAPLATFGSDLGKGAPATPVGGM